jgi:adenylylsulfate kinase-like enzyme
LTSIDAVQWAGQMPDNLLQVLWVCGPAGVGKSTVSWQLFTQLAEAGAPVAFADTDQLGMCHPAAAGEPGRQRVKLQNVAAMMPNYRAAGARYAIINGVLDPVVGLPAGLLPQSAVTICRLRARPDEVERRFLTRGGQSKNAAGWLREVRDEIASFDRSSFADACVDTTDVAQSDVAGLVREVCKSWPGFSADHAAARRQRGELAGSGFDAAGIDAARADAARADAARADAARADAARADAARADAARADAPAVDGQVMLIAGPTGVGKSTVGFQVYINCLKNRLGAGYVDLEQVGFAEPVRQDAIQRHRLRARNLAAVWRNYRAAGATHLVATGPIEDRAAVAVYAAELPAASVGLCRLRAGYDQLSQRIMSRAAGGSWPQPGDPLLGKPAETLRAVAKRAAEDAAALDRYGPGGVAIDTDGLTAEEAAEQVARAFGWASLDGREQPGEEFHLADS